MNRTREALLHPATAIAVLALVIASGGTGYAVAQVTGKDVKNSSLTGKDIKDGSLSASDGDASLKGPAGPQGPAGPPGAPATSTFTLVQHDISASQGTKEGTADCPPGSKVVSGSFIVSPNVAVHVLRSYPVDQDSWLVRVYDPVAQSFSLTIQAICVS